VDSHGRHLSCRLLQPLLDTVQDILGAEGVEKIALGLGMSLEELRDPDGWISIQQCIELNERVEDATGDPLITYKAGRVYLQSARYLGPAYHLLRGLGTPAQVMKGLENNARMLNRVANWELVQLDKGHATVAYWSDDGVPDHPLFCQNRRGSMEGMPELFHLPAGRVEHTECLNSGADRCVYEVYWIDRPDGARVLIPLAVVGLAVGLGTLAAGASPWVSGLLLGSGGLALAAYAHSVVRKIGQLRDWTNESLETLRAEASANQLKADGLDALRGVDARLRAITTESELLENLLDPVRESLDYDRLLLLLRDVDTLRLVASSGLTFNQRTILSGFEVPFVRKEGRPNTFRAIMEEGEARLIVADEEYVQGLPARSQQAMIGTGSGEFIAAPLMAGESPMGILLVDQGGTGAQLTATDIQLCGRLANVLALAISNARLFDRVRRRERALADSLMANQKFVQYLPRNVAEGILEDPAQALKLGGEPREAAVLFADIAGFTTWASAVTAQEVVALLNRWFSETDTAISAHTGIVDKRIGDGLMVVFLHEDDVPHPAQRAYDCALELLDRARALVPEADAAGFGTFGIRVGVNFGECVAGNIGSPSRLEYTLVGDVVNLAQRLESVAPVGNVRVSASVVQHIGTGAVHSGGLQDIKGKAEPIEVFGPAP